MGGLQSPPLLRRPRWINTLRTVTCKRTAAPSPASSDLVGDPRAISLDRSSNEPPLRSAHFLERGRRGACATLRALVAMLLSSIGIRRSEDAAAGHQWASKSRVYGARMDTTANTARFVSFSSSNRFTSSAVSAPSVVVPVAQLSDTELLTSTRKLVGRSNQLLADLLAHLAEVEARGIHRTRACSSLYTYCIYELRFSEDEAFRRVAAARLVRRFPALVDALASGELHLTGLLMLGPHLTEQNLPEVLARAKHRTKRELTRLVRLLDPLPQVPARIEPLGPAPARLVPSEPSWEEFIHATCPVRELGPGERPRDWMATEDEPLGDTATVADTSGDDTSGATGTLAHVLPGSERYKVQFTANEEYVKLVDEAKALLSHAVPNATLDDIQLRAMRAFVAGLRKKKYATLGSSAASVSSESASAMESASGSESASRSESASGSTRPRPAEPTLATADRGGHPRRRGDGRERGRHIPAAVRRAVATRDGERCSYVDASGRRCSETHRLEFHHVTPFARGGLDTSSNLTLRCRAHNDLPAEADFGRHFMEHKRVAPDHEPPAGRS